MFGRLVGQYGIEVLLSAGLSTVGRVSAIHNFRSANIAMTLRAATKSKETKAVILTVSKKFGERATPYIEKLKTGTKLLEKDLKFFRQLELSEIQVRVILHQAGYKTFPRPKGIPSDWKVAISTDNGGMVYIKPNQKFNNECVRVMQGDPTSQWSNCKKPYVVHRNHGGVALDKSGKLLEKVECLEADIPLEEYDFFKVMEGQRK